MTTSSSDLWRELQDVLNRRTAHPYPHLPTPEGCRKRASVALIIRIRPAFTPATPEGDGPLPPVASLDDFFSQPWVQNGDPEILFIKRAGRPGDRWSGHVALPGGKRDPDDESDVAAAIRETKEEVGLDLSNDHCLQVGNLPERVVATTWGRVPLMVLCPFLFLLTSQDTPRVSPQPTEVAAAHWVPLRALLSPTLRTREYVDTTSRMTKQGGVVAQWALRMLVGRMVFSAVQLLPSESVYATEIEDFVPPQSESRMVELVLGSLPLPVESARHRLAFQQPILLWGLTLGVLGDFLDALPPYNAISLWRYPTFTPLDLRALIWLFTRGLRRDNAADLSAGTWSMSENQTAIDATTQAIAVTEAEPRSLRPSGKKTSTNPQDAVGRLLEGYYARVNTAIVAFVVYRVALGSMAGYWLWKRYGNSR